MCLWLTLGLAFLSFPVRSQTIPGANSNTPDGSPYRKLRSISGAVGHEENGRFKMDDPRSAFTAGTDAKVIVYFEWEGPVGPHHFEGLWKSPEGKLVMLSDFRYEARGPRYSGYWTMLLTDSTPSGEWSIEARIDGEAAGTHTFIITGSPVPSSARPAAPQLMSNAELYRTAMDAAVMIEKLGPDGQVAAKTSGFWLDDGVILTTFSAIDGASSLRVQTLSRGTLVSTDQVLARNRWQDWALLGVPAKAPAKLKRSATNPVNVGDRCVFLEWGPAGAKLTDGSITGKNSFAKAGERLLVASAATPQSVGGPLLNEFGEFVGMIAGDIAPGGESMKLLVLTSGGPSHMQGLDMEVTALAAPLSLLPVPSQHMQPTSLAEINAAGEFLPLVQTSNLIGMATFTSYMEKDPDRPLFVRNYHDVFSRKENKASVYVSWSPREKKKVKVTLRLFDLDNRLISEAKDREISLAPGKFAASAWDVTVSTMPAGLYRTDLLLNGATIWRGFFRITD